MIGVSHVVLHVALCRAALASKPETNLVLRVRLLDSRANVKLDRTYRFERGDDDYPKIAEFDAGQGIYQLDLRLAHYGCSGRDYVALLPDRVRSVSETLAPGNPTPAMPLLMEGASPQSFLYVQPTFVLLDKTAAGCGKPVGDLVPLRVTVENDQDAYYAWLYPDPAAGDRPVQLALQLRTPTHQYHYVRVPIPFPMPATGWPSNVRFDVTQDEIDDLASQPTGTLLCLKLWETKVSY